MTEYVYIQCSDTLWRINLAKLSGNSTWSHPYVSSASDDEASKSFYEPYPRVLNYTTPFEQVLNFIDQGMPVGMVPIVVNQNQNNSDAQKLYFVGGVKLGKGFSGLDYFICCRDLAVDQSHGHNGFNQSVFSIINSCSSSSSIPPLNAPKFRPIFATYENKTYVFARAKDDYSETLMLPTFEVYDHALGVWETLPEPPVYLGRCINYHFIFNRTFYIGVAHRFLCYNIDTRVWKFVDDMKNDLSFLGRGTGHVAEYDGYAVCYGDCNKLVSYCFDDRNGRHQPPLRVLDELKDLVEDPYLKDGQGHVFHLGNGKMCFLMYGYLSKDWKRFLRVATFQFNPCGQSDVLTNHIFNARKLPFGVEEMNNVFTMVEESRKRVLESWGDDRTSKKLETMNR